MSLEFKIRFPEVPRGENLLTLIVNKAREAIIEAYPSVQDLAYIQDRVITPERVVLESFERLKERQRSEKPADKILTYNSMLATGVDKDLLDDLVYYGTGDTSPFYCNPFLDAPPTIYVSSDHYQEPLTSEDSGERRRVLFSLADELIMINFRHLPVLRRLQRSPKLRELAKSGADNFFDALGKELPQHKDKLDYPRNLILEIMDEKKMTRFYAYGGMIIVTIPDQTPITAGFSIDYIKHINTAGLLSFRPYALFVQKISRYLDIKPPNVKRLKRDYETTSFYAGIKNLNPNSVEGLKNLVNAYVTSSLPGALNDIRG